MFEKKETRKKKKLNKNKKKNTIFSFKKKKIDFFVFCVRMKKRALQITKSDSYYCCRNKNKACATLSIGSIAYLIASFLKLCDLIPLSISCTFLFWPYLKVLAQRATLCLDFKEVLDNVFVHEIQQSVKSLSIYDPDDGFEIPGLYFKKLTSENKKLLNLEFFPNLTRLNLTRLTLDLRFTVINDNMNSSSHSYNVIFPKGLLTLDIGHLDIPLNNNGTTAFNKFPISYDERSKKMIGFQLPSTLTQLELTAFNDYLEVGCFPESLKSLRLGDKFNQPIYTGVFPFSLTKLYFGINFQQPLIGSCLPPYLKKLSLGCLYDFPIHNLFFPSTLTKLKLSTYFNNPLSSNEEKDGKTYLPSFLTKLCIGQHFTNSIETNALPITLQVLKIYGSPSVIFEKSLPTSLIILHIDNLFGNQAILQPLILLQGLYFIASFNETIVPGMLPSSITELDMGTKFSKPLSPGVLPNSLTCLWLSLQFNRDIKPGVLPPNLTKLHMGYRFNQMLLPGVFPNSLTSLTMSYMFNCDIFPHVLPLRLVHLYVPQNFKKLLQPYTLPASLTSLYHGILRLKIPPVDKSCDYFIKPINQLENIQNHSPIFNPNNQDKLEDRYPLPTLEICQEERSLGKHM